MKHLAYLFVILFVLTIDAEAQELLTAVDSHTGDTIVSTGFDTLAIEEKNDSVPDRVVAVKTIHKGESTYWLFFYFTTSDISSNPVSISQKNYAYFVKDDNEYFRMPYKGKTFRYSSDENAGFFIDITQYLNRLRSSEFKFIRLETSNLYHEIILPPGKTSAIANLVSRLTK